jgi:hypothetical protein
LHHPPGLLCFLDQAAPFTFAHRAHMNNHILARWKDVNVDEIKPLAIRNWLVDLHDGEDYVWETCSKIAGIMSLILSFVDHDEI